MKTRDNVRQLIKDKFGPRDVVKIFRMTESHTDLLAQIAAIEDINSRKFVSESDIVHKAVAHYGLLYGLRPKQTFEL